MTFFHTPRSIKGRMLWITLSWLTVLWLLTAWVTWRVARHELDELLDSHLSQAAALLVVQQSREASEGYHHDQIETPSLHRYAPQVIFQVWHNGELGLRSAQAPQQPLSALRSGYETRWINGTPWRIFAAQGAEHDVQVYVGERMRSRRDIAWAVLRSTLWPLALALPLMALAVWWGTQWALRPLQALRDALKGRHAQTLTPISLHRPALEILPVQEALNQMLSRIDELLSLEKRFTADAAHELRTPLAAIRAQAQVALSSEQVSVQHEALLSVLKGCDRAAHTVDQLLQLARLDHAAQHNAQAMPTSTFDLAQCAREVMASLAARAQDRQQTLACVAPPEACIVTGDEPLWSLALRNLCDNALRHGPPGTQVRMHIDKTDRHTRLRVEDSGPGMRPADMARLGERFFRATDTQAAGSGLGWSIVRLIAQTQGVQLHVEPSSGLGGLCVSLVWPAPGQPSSHQPVRAG